MQRISPGNKPQTVGQLNKKVSPLSVLENQWEKSCTQGHRDVLKPKVPGCITSHLMLRYFRLDQSININLNIFLAWHVLIHFSFSCPCIWPRAAVIQLGICGPCFVVRAWGCWRSKPGTKLSPMQRLSVGPHLGRASRTCFLLVNCSLSCARKYQNIYLEMAGSWILSSSSLHVWTYYRRQRRRGLWSHKPGARINVSANPGLCWIFMFLFSRHNAVSERFLT